MTREEAIEWLNRELKVWEKDCLSKHPIKEALSVAIEALEQEQYYKDLAESYGKTINKLTKAIAEQEPILDKIKAEIEQDAFKDVNGSKYIFVNRVNQILDKYKAESEGKDG